MQCTPVILLALAALTGVQSAVPADRVLSLPGLASQPLYKHYSGYLKATGTKRLHYWYIEAQTDPDTAPVVLWMNGGPGCSSMDGLLTEHGPFRVADAGKTININPYSWNRLANMLYLEAPAGVGYSYSEDKNYTTSDDEVALDNHAALKYFFSQYPELSSNDFFITGESYGGIYVPTLAARIVQDKSFNFKGFAVGNGMSDYSMNGNSIIYFGYIRGLWGKSLWSRLVDNCCVAGNTSDCDFANPGGENCLKAVSEAGGVIQGLNIYNMYAECLSDASLAAKNTTVIHSTDVMLGGSALYPSKPMNLYAAKASGKRVSLSPPCIDSTASTVFMNRDDVKKAIHIPTDLPPWEICSAEVGGHYKRIYTNMKAQYMQVLSTGFNFGKWVTYQVDGYNRPETTEDSRVRDVITMINKDGGPIASKYITHRVLVYNGDVDMACNFLMDEWFTDSLGLPVLEENRAWKYTAKDGTTQVGGYVKQFKNLVYTTVRGAGHMVPTDRPIPALELFTAFLRNQRLP